MVKDTEDRSVKVNIEIQMQANKKWHVLEMTPAERVMWEDTFMVAIQSAIEKVSIRRGEYEPGYWIDSLTKIDFIDYLGIKK